MAAVYECERATIQRRVSSNRSSSRGSSNGCCISNRERACVERVWWWKKTEKAWPSSREVPPFTPSAQPLHSFSQLTSFTVLRVHAILALVLSLLLWLLLLVLLVLLLFLRHGLRLSLVHNGHRLVLGLHALMRIRTTKAALSVHVCGVDWTVSSL